MRGLYVKQNDTQARSYFEKAAEKKLPASYNGLGVMHWVCAMPAWALLQAASQVLASALHRRRPGIRHKHLLP